MLKKHSLLSSLLSSVLLLSYIAGISLFLNNIEKIFGNEKIPEVMGVMLMLSLLVFSALICGVLLLGGPLYLYFEKEKKAAFKMLTFNIIFLASILIIAGILLLIL